LELPRDKTDPLQSNQEKFDGLELTTKTCKSPLDEDTVKKYLKALKDNWKASWETKKLKNSYVGSKGWKDFHRELVKTIRKAYSDFRE
jgi:hypothetical protein